MSDPEEIKVNVMGEIVTVLDYGDGVFISKPQAGGFDTPENRLRDIAAAHAIELLAAAHKRGPKVKANRKNASVVKDRSRAWKQAVTVWVDKHLSQRKLRKAPNASDLATRLLRPSSDFEWPEGVKPVGHDEVRKVIGAHLNAQKTP